MVNNIWVATAATGPEGFVNYGIAGLLFLVCIIPMAIYIVKDKEKQIKAKDAEIARLLTDNVEMRRVLEEFPPAIQDMTRTMSVAIQFLRPGGTP